MSEIAYRLRRDPEPVLVNGQPRGRRRRHDFEPIDWSSGPPAVVVLSCGHEVLYRPPSPAKGDFITCGRCRLPAVVRKPIRRLDRHAPPLTAEDLLPAQIGENLAKVGQRTMDHEP